MGRISSYRNFSIAILRIGLPLMLGQLGIILVGFVDNIMVGHYGTAELAAASFVNNFINLAVVLGIGFSYGLTPLVSSAFVRNDGRARTLLRGSLIANGIMGVLLTIVMAIFLWQIEIFEQPTELLPLIRPYYLVHLSSIIIMMLFFAYKEYANGVDRAKYAMYVMLASNLVNILLNYLLIFGKMGFPEMGLLGAGLATFAARLFCLVALGWLVERGKVFKHVMRKVAQAPKAIQTAIVQLFKIGIPIGAQLGVEVASFSLAVIMVGWLGALSLAAHQIISVISTLGFMIYYGVAAAITILISRYHEQRDSDSIRGITSSGLLLLLLLATLYVIVLAAFRHVIGRLFTQEVELIQLVATLCLPVMIYQFGDVLQILFANVLRGLRDVQYMAICAIICHIGIALSAVYIFTFTFSQGVVGTWMAFPLSLTILGILLFLRYRQVMRRMIEPS